MDKTWMSIADRMIRTDKVIIVGVLILGFCYPDHLDTIIGGLLGFLTKSIMDKGEEER